MEEFLETTRKLLLPDVETRSVWSGAVALGEADIWGIYQAPLSTHPRMR